MAYKEQTTVQDTDAIRIGSVKWEIGPNIAGLVDVGALRGASFKENFSNITIKSDNAGTISEGIEDHHVILSGELMEIDLDVLEIVYAGLGTRTTVAAAPVSITDEEVTLNDQDLAVFTYRNGDKSEVDSIVVADAATPTITYVRGCDYVVVTRADGYTGIARADATAIDSDIDISADTTDDSFNCAGSDFATILAPGDHITVSGFTEAANNGVFTVVTATNAKITVSENLTTEIAGDAVVITRGGIADGATVYVDYDYTPLASQSYTTGGKNTLTDRVMRFTNENVDGQVWRMTVYKATIQDGLDLKFPADDDREPLRCPISIKGVLDDSRTSGDQLFAIYDEQDAS